jgi:hypothetical protein
MSRMDYLAETMRAPVGGWTDTCAPAIARSAIPPNGLSTVGYRRTNNPIQRNDMAELTKRDTKLVQYLNGPMGPSDGSRARSRRTSK